MNYPALATILAVVLASAGESPKDDSSQKSVIISDCVITLIDEVSVPAKQAGVIRLLEIREGDEVDKDQLLLQIDDRDAHIREQGAKYEHKIAEEQSKNMIRIEAAVASAKVSDTELEQNEEINRQSPGAVSLIQVKKLELQSEHAHLQVGLARFEQSVSKLTSKVRFFQLQMASNDVIDRRLIAPWDAVVVERMRHEGEWVQQGEPVLRLVRMGHLRVEGFLSLDQVSPLEIDGSNVIISIDLGRGRVQQIHSTISFVSPQIEGGEFRVWAEFKNVRVKNHQGKLRWLLRPGMSAGLKVDVNELKAPQITEK